MSVDQYSMKQQLLTVLLSHIAENCLSVITFHGSNRVNEPQAFIGSDLVFTTYSTLVKDYQNARVLHRLRWFRIVLDEGNVSQDFRLS